MKLLPLGSTVFLATCFALSSPVGAQDTTAGGLHRRCREVDSILATGPYTGAEVIRAVYDAPGCKHAGDVLAAVWSSPPTDTAELEVLVSASSTVRDQRIYDGSLSALIGGYPTLVRLAALRVFASYGDRTLRPRFMDLRRPPRPGITSLSVDSRPDTENGAVPLNGNIRGAIVAALEPIKDSDPDPDVAYGAKLIWKELYHVDYDGIRLAYVCGNKFRVRNPNPVSVSVRYQVSGTNEADDLLLPPRPTGQPHGEFILTTDSEGTVRLYDENRLLRSEANGGTTCPP